MKPTFGRLRNHASRQSTNERQATWLWAGLGSVAFPPHIPSARARTGPADRGCADADGVIWVQFPGLDDLLFNNFYSVIYAQYVKRTGFETVR